VDIKQLITTFKGRTYSEGDDAITEIVNETVKAVCEEIRDADCGIEVLFRVVCDDILDQLNQCARSAHNDHSEGGKSVSSMAPNDGSIVKEPKDCKNFKEKELDNENN
jgi:hypothetical protein